MPLPTGAKHRFRADAVTGLTSGSKMTTTCPNEGSSTATASQATDTLRPLWISSVASLNNHAAFRGDGVDDILTVANFDTETLATVMWIGTLDPAKTTAGQPFFGTTQEVFWTLDSQHGLFTPAGALAVAGNPTREVTVWTGVFNASGSTSQFRKRGTQAIAGTTISNNGEAGNVGGLGNHTNTGLGRAWPGDWTEFVYWPRILTAAEIDEAESYAQDTYGVPVANYIASWIAPSNLTTTVVSGTQVDLSWTAVTGARFYQIERNGVLLSARPTTNTFSDTTVSGGTANTYRVRAFK